MREKKKVGDIVGFLTLKYKIKKEKGYFWVCDCKCGKVIERRCDSLYRPVNQSCGCYFKYKKFQKPKGRKSIGYGEVPGHYITRIRNSAKERNKEYAITAKYLWELFLKQNKQCAITGLPIKFSPIRSQQKGIEQTASLDRKDNNIGYIEDNVWWVHKDVNMMRGHYSLDRFKKICELVVLYNKLT